MAGRGCRGSQQLGFRSGGLVGLLRTSHVLLVQAGSRQRQGGTWDLTFLEVRSMARNLVAVAAALLPALAAAQITGPVLIGPEPMLVHGGPGAQTEPHVSGSLISYTNRSGLTFSEIRYQD